MQRFLTRDLDFALALTVFVDPVAARRSREQALERAGDHGHQIATVTLRSQDHDADLIERIATASLAADAVFVDGLDELLVDPLGRPWRTPALVNFNLRRDELPERIHAPVVLWVSKRGYRALAQIAWDLLEVTLTRFELSTIEPLTVLPPPEPRVLGFGLVLGHAIPEVLSAAQGWLDRANSVNGLAAEADAAAAAAAMFVAAGELIRGAELLERSLAIYIRGCNWLAAATQTLRLASLLLYLGEYSRAEARAREALQWKTAWIELSALDLLADVHGARGDISSAEQVLGQLIARSESVGFRPRLAAGLAKLGSLAPEQPNEQRERDLERAAALFAELGDHLGHSLARRNLADRRMALGRTLEAYDILVDEVLPPLLPYPQGDRLRFVNGILWRLVRIHAAQGNLDRASSLLSVIDGRELGPEFEQDLARVRAQLVATTA
ncbi:MAG TPA: hypothetical protein VK034_01185 [Enhygromyxa sp.]|nr:hypothetical protein [Enhygromyxa sp.]